MSDEMFERRMVDPVMDELAAVLERAMNAAGWSGPQPGQDRTFWEGIAVETRNQPEGSHTWRNRRVAWWTDHIGRRHGRVTRSIPVWVDPSAPRPVPRDWPPLGQVYPEHVLLRRKAGGDSDFLAVCRCGAFARPAALGWMGDCCAVCHDRGQERIRFARGISEAPLTFLGHPWSEPGVLGLVFARDGSTLLSVGRGGRVKRWDLETGKDRIVAELNEPLSAVVEASVGQTVLLFDRNGGVHEIDVATGQHHLVPSVPLHFACAAVAPDGRILIAGERRRYFLLARTTQTTEPVEALAGVNIGRAAFAPDGSLYSLYSEYAGSDGRGLLWRTDLRRGQTTTLIENRSLSHRLFACSPDGRWLAVSIYAENRDRLFLWDVRANCLREHPMDTGGFARTAAFTPDGQILAAATCTSEKREGGVRFWALPEGREIGMLHFYPLPAWALAFSPDGNLLAASDCEGGIRLLPWRQLLADPSCRALSELSDRVALMTCNGC